MSCEHTETTAVLYAFGEAPEAFAAHLDGCAACRAVVAEHRETAAWVQPAFARDADARTSAPRRGWVLALAAVALLGVGWQAVPWPRSASQPVADTQPASGEPAVLDLSDPLEAELRELDGVLASIAFDLETP